MQHLSTVFFGTPRFATTVLDALKARGHVPSLIVTQPDEPQGRGLVVQPPPAKLWADEHGVPCVQPQTLRSPSDELDAIINTEWDAAIVAAYGLIIPEALLAGPKRGYLNVHPSLLPKYRGATPLEAQILAGETEVGVTIIELDAQMDHGPILAQASLTLPELIPRGELETLLATEGGELLADVLATTVITKEPQDHDAATFTKKIEKKDGLIDLTDAEAAYRKYLAFSGTVGTYYFHLRHGKEVRVKINEAAMIDGIFQPLVVTPEGKRPMKYEDFLRGS